VVNEKLIGERSVAFRLLARAQPRLHVHSAFGADGAIDSILVKSRHVELSENSRQMQRQFAEKRRVAANRLFKRRWYECAFWGNWHFHMGRGERTKMM
jgi:hypothetical protein